MKERLNFLKKEIINDTEATATPSILEQIENRCIEKTTTLCKKIYKNNFTIDQYKELYRNLYPSVSNQFFAELKENIVFKNNTFYKKENPQSDIIDYHPLPLKEDKFFVAVLKSLYRLIKDIFKSEKENRAITAKKLNQKRYTLNYLSDELIEKIKEIKTENFMANYKIEQAIKEIKEKK